MSAGEEDTRKKKTSEKKSFTALAGEGQSASAKEEDHAIGGGRDS